MPPATVLSVLDAPTLEQARRLTLLTSGYAELDFFEPVKPGQVTLLTGANGHALYNYIASATRSGTVLVIDGGNRIDAYEIVEAGSKLGMASDEALSRVYVARAFTPYQMESLVERVVPEWLANGPPEGAPHRDELSLVVINDLATQYLDEDTPRREGDKLHSRALRIIKAYSRTHGARVPIALTSTIAPRDDRNRQFMERQIQAADDIVTFAPRDKDGATRIGLPNGGTAILARPAGITQRAIDEWMTTPLVAKAG